jgi:hypothetical protein
MITRNFRISRGKKLVRAPDLIQPQEYSGTVRACVIWITNSARVCRQKSPAADR